jgi:hypothetical protein
MSPILISAPTQFADWASAGSRSWPLKKSTAGRADKAMTPSTDTLQRIPTILRQSIRRAQARDLVKRNG